MSVNAVHCEVSFRYEGSDPPGPPGGALEVREHDRLGTAALAHRVVGEFRVVEGVEELDRGLTEEREVAAVVRGEREEEVRHCRRDLRVRTRLNNIE